MMKCKNFGWYNQRKLDDITTRSKKAPRTKNIEEIWRLRNMEI